MDLFGGVEGVGRSRRSWKSGMSGGVEGAGGVEEGGKSRRGRSGLGGVE